ncbi:MAG: hypothetical protein K2X81_05815, partial [Candidatus Obscuribacterales bacterium]|nr:hypothetical protein [Candidatus Obscuribacterales bacterium]
MNLSPTFRKRFVASILSFTFTSAISMSATNATTSSETLILKHRWNPWHGPINKPKSITLDVELFTVGAEKEWPKTGQIRILEGNKVLLNKHFDYKPMQVTSNGIGNLVVTWQAGGPYMVVTVYSFRDGTIKQVLEANTKVLPEIVNNTSDPSSEPLLIIGSALRSRGKAPATADIYRWNSKNRSYTRRTVDWSHRLSFTH